MGFFIPNSMQNKDTHTDLKNWPCYLEKLHEDETTTFYADNFSGHRVFVHVQQGGQIFIQAENGIIINDYIKTVYKPSVFNDNGANGVLVKITSFSGWKNREVYPFQATR